MPPKKAQTQELQTKALTSWQQEMADKAKSARAQIIQGVSRITHEGGMLAVDKKPLQGNKLEVVIIDSILANEYYTTKFQPGVPASPGCYAFGGDVTTMAPHPEAPEKQSPTCAACKWNVYGSAENGKGKACRNTARLLVVMPIDKPDAYAKQEKRQISVPPTSLKPWGNFLAGLTDTTLTGSPLEAVTSLSTTRRPGKTYHELTFDMVRRVPDNAVEALFELSKKSAGLLSQPFPKLDAGEAPTAKVARKSRKLD